MREIAVTAVLIAATALLIGLIRILTVKKSDCVKPAADLRIYYDESCGCLEYTLSGLARSGIFDMLDLDVTVVDGIDTCDSAAFLAALRRKTGVDFAVEREETSDS